MLDPHRLVIAPVDKSNWADLETLFESRGGPKHCWCMVWRRSSEEARNQDGAFRKSLLRTRVEQEIPIGLLAYLDQKPAGWCSIAPRDSHRAGLSLVFDGDEADVIWSLVCFYIPAVLRGMGMMQPLLSAASSHAKAEGATLIEAYPVEPESPSFRYGGFLTAFEQAGFSEVGRIGKRRHIWRRRLT